jgi:hypothetical protein
VRSPRIRHVLGTLHEGVAGASQTQRARVNDVAD